MKQCLYCDKEFEAKRDSAKFCSTSCRVMHNRKHGKKNTVTPVQMQALFNAMMEKLGEVGKIVAVTPKEAYDRPPLKITYDEPPKFLSPQIALKSFEQWQREKRECETEEQWEEIKAGIKAATNLTQKQKDLLIKYS